MKINFMVKMNIRYVQKYKNKNEWQSLGAISTQDIREHISPLISKLKDDEFAKRFDILMYTIELANLQGNNATRPIKSVIETAESLSKLGTIPEIQQQKYIIDNELFSQFLNNKNLNAKQIHFVKLIIDYVVKNGFIDDNKILQEDPFRGVGNISILFKDSRNEVISIMSKVAEIKNNAEIICN